MIGHNHLGKNGRFGNQMFQYAATRGIAARKGYEWCIPDGPKNDEEFYDEENQHKLFMAFKMESVKVVNMHPAPYKQEGSFTFDQDIFDNCEDNINLYGYFQCEKYFKHIEDEIRNDFTFYDDVTKDCKDVINNIDSEIISLHIRRGDYLYNPNHPVQPIEYYAYSQHRTTMVAVLIPPRVGSADLSRPVPGSTKGEIVGSLTKN